MKRAKNERVAPRGNTPKGVGWRGWFRRPERPPPAIPHPLDIADLDTHSSGRQVALTLAPGAQTFLGNEDGPPEQTRFLNNAIRLPACIRTRCHLLPFVLCDPIKTVGHRAPPSLFGEGNDLHIKRELPSRGRPKKKLRFIATQCCLTRLYQKERPAPLECAHQHLPLPAPRGPTDAW